MYPSKSQDSRGRPITGSEKKDKILKIRLEPWLLSELTYTCRMVGCTRAEAIRQGIKMWIKQVRQHI